MPARNTTTEQDQPEQATTDAVDSGEPTTSTSAQDASTTQGQAAAAAAGQTGDVTRVQIEQAPAEPAVYYDGEGRPSADPDKPYTPAKYEPFTW